MERKYMKGNKKGQLMKKVIEILDREGWDSDYSKIKQVKLYCGDLVEIKRSDIIATKDNKTIVIEYEGNPNPKNLIGTLGVINIANQYRTKEEKKDKSFPFNDIILYIIYNDGEKNENNDKNKNKQIEIIKKYFKVGEGSLKKFEIVTLDKFEKSLLKLG